MLSRIFVCVAIAAAVSGQSCEHTSCNRGLIKYYKELNCLPVQESGACCPTRFDCTAALSGRALNKCHVGGRSYPIGSRVTQAQIGNKCVAECRCTGDGSEARLNCANIECPEHLGVRPPANCSFIYSHDKCCSVGTVCSSVPFTCQHGGNSYRVGQTFYPDEEPCLQCICQEGYDGTLREPWCKEINCGIEVHSGERIRNGCAPVHYGSSRCCPIDWRCPSGSDSVVTSGNTASTPASGECVFGNLRLKVGDKLNAEKSCVECKCTLPPHVSCVQNGNC